MGSYQSIQYTLMITSDNKHIFLCPLEIYISSSVNSLLILCMHFHMGLSFSPVNSRSPFPVRNVYLLPHLPPKTLIHNTTYFIS